MASATTRHCGFPACAWRGRCLGDRGVPEVGRDRPGSPGSSGPAPSRPAPIRGYKTAARAGGGRWRARARGGRTGAPASTRKGARTHGDPGLSARVAPSRTAPRGIAGLTGSQDLRHARQAKCSRAMKPPAAQGSPAAAGECGDPDPLCAVQGIQGLARTRQSVLLLSPQPRCLLKARVLKVRDKRRGSPRILPASPMGLYPQVALGARFCLAAHAGRGIRAQHVPSAS